MRVYGECIVCRSLVCVRRAWRPSLRRTCPCSQLCVRALRRALGMTAWLGLDWIGVEHVIIMSVLSRLFAWACLVPRPPRGSGAVRTYIHGHGRTHAPQHAAHTHACMYELGRFY